MQKKSVLYVAFHYPPILGSSGVHRTLAFTRYLSENNWDVTVLTASLKAYPRWEEEQKKLIPRNVDVIRTFARRTSKDFSFKGKYLDIMAQPDDWQSWIIPSIVTGLIAIKKRKINVIVSTYPIASAHIIGYFLHRFTGLPWVADLRDPMAQDDYPKDPLKKKIFLWVESKIIKHASCAVLTAPGAQLYYQTKYPNTPSSFWKFVPNGYDHTLLSSFVSEDKEQADTEKRQTKVILHSGVIYPEERDPKQFFEAIAILKNEGLFDKYPIELRLRATGHDALFSKQVSSLGIDDIVTFVPPVPFKDAVLEMLNVDGLLLLQSEGCNFQIPAKAYEYIWSRKPVLVLAPREGDSGQLMAKFDDVKIAPLDNTGLIAKALKDFISDGINFEKTNRRPDADIFEYSREYQASIFSDLIASFVR